MVCLDLGCGGRDVTFELARLVGPQGKAVGMDMDGVKLRVAREDAERFNQARPHQGLQQRIPAPEESAGPARDGQGRGIAFPVLGGLHHDDR